MSAPGAPRKSKGTEKKTAQTGMMEELDAPRPGYVTPKKKTGTEVDDLTDSPVKVVEVSEPTADEAEIGSRNEKVRRGLLEAEKEMKMGKGRRSRKHKKSKKHRKTRKVKKHGKRRA